MDRPLVEVCGQRHCEYWRNGCAYRLITGYWRPCGVYPSCDFFAGPVRANGLPFEAEPPKLTKRKLRGDAGMKKLKADNEAKRLELYNAGAFDPEIGQACGVGAKAIQNWRKSRGLPANGKAKGMKPKAAEATATATATSTDTTSTSTDTTPFPIARPSAEGHSPADAGHDFKGETACFPLENPLLPEQESGENSATQIGVQRSESDLERTTPRRRTSAPPDTGADGSRKGQEDEDGPPAGSPPKDEDAVDNSMSAEALGLLLFEGAPHGARVFVRVLGMRMAVKGAIIGKHYAADGTPEDVTVELLG